MVGKLVQGDCIEVPPAELTLYIHDAMQVPRQARFGELPPSGVLD